jgi:hypothetical protein
LDEEEEQRLEQAISRYRQDVELPPYDNSSSEHNRTAEYQKYQSENEESREKSLFEKLCIFSARIVPIAADEKTRDRLAPPIRLLQLAITPGMVVSAAITVSITSFVAWLLLFALNSVLGLLPTFTAGVFVLGPIVAGLYTYYKPVFDAKEKVVRSSQGIVLSVLYMVIYMEETPSMEGAVRFAALNLDGPISSDLKKVLWDVETGNFKTVEESLNHYSEVWQDYNEDYLQSLQLLEASVKESNASRREDLLDDAMERMLDGTEEKMNSYAKGLKTPVAILNAFGALLPILGMILLPMISVFIDIVTLADMVVLFNVLLPLSLFLFQRQILSSRPPTISTEPLKSVELPERGNVQFDILGHDLSLPSKLLGFLVFAVVAIYGIWGYITFPYLLPLSESASQLGASPSLFYSDGSANPVPALLRGVSIIAGAGLGIATSKILGVRQRKEAEDELEKIEGQFPGALFELGNQVSGGTPVEIAVKDAARSASDLEISGLFAKTSQNIEQLGMTFQEALFDNSYGAVQKYPTRTIQTVMKALSASSQKGTQLAADTAVTISRYLDNISRTQRKLEDLMEEPTTTIELLAYLLAPVVSGVAVGMSQTITTSVSAISSQFSDIGATTATQLPSSSIFSSSSTISPEAVQFVVGIYLIQLLFILGNFYMKVTHGQNKTYRDLFTGKVMLSGMIFYALTVVIISTLFTQILLGATSAL